MEFITEKDIEGLNDEYYKGRYKYLEEVIDQVKILDNISSTLELGPYKTPLIKGGDVIDITDEFVNDYPLEIGNFYKHDCSITPYPFNDKKYDLVIACQVLEHLDQNQSEVFKEFARISKMAIITLPYKWNVPCDVHHMIDRKIIDRWSSGFKPIFEKIIDSRILRIYCFDDITSLEYNKKIQEHANFQLKNQLELEKKKMENLEKELLQAQNQIQQKEKQLKQAQNQIQQKEKQLKQAQNQIQQKEKQLKQAQNQIQQKEKQLKQAQNQIQQKEKQLKQAQNQIQQKEKQLKQAQNQIQENQNNYRNLKEEIDHLNSHFYEIKYRNNKGRPFSQRLISRFPTLYILLNRKNNGIKKKLINIKGYKAIKKNNLLNVGYYLKNYEDVRLSGMDPILHYMYYGFVEGRTPNPQFDTDYYLNKNDDVKRSKLNPLVHFSLYGSKEGRKTIQEKKSGKK